MLKTIQNPFTKYLKTNCQCYHFFGGGFMGCIGILGLNCGLLLLGALYLICCGVLIYMDLIMTNCVNACKNIACAFLGIFTDSSALATLLSGALALIAAIWTIKKMQNQIDLEKDKKRALQDYKRAKLQTLIPKTTAHYSKLYNNLTVYFPSSPHGNDDENQRENIFIEFEPFPEKSIEEYASLLESCDSKTVVKNIVSIIKISTILDARLNKLTRENKDNTRGLRSLGQINMHIYSCAFLHMLASSLYKYARFESDTTTSIEFDEFSNSIVSIGIAINIYDIPDYPYFIRECYQSLIDICDGKPLY